MQIMKKKIISLTIMLVFAIALTSQVMSANAIRFQSVEGTVADYHRPGNPAISGVKVTLTDYNGFSKTTYTNSYGHYYLVYDELIMPGSSVNLRVSFSKSGYNPAAVSTNMEFGEQITIDKKLYEEGTIYRTFTGKCEELRWDSNYNIYTVPVSGVEITVTNKYGKVVKTVYSSSSGNYNTGSICLPSGTTTLKATRSHVSIITWSVSLSSSGTTTHNFLWIPRR